MSTFPEELSKSTPNPILKKLQDGIMLRADINRPELTSLLSQQLLNGEIPDSLTELERHKAGTPDGVKARVLLMVPSYTRIRRPLEVMANSLSAANGPKLKEDLELIDLLKAEGLKYIEEMKRAGVPMGLLRVGTQAKARGHDIKIIDGAYGDWDNENYYFTTEEGSEMWTYGLSDEKMKVIITDYQPDVVGISCDYSHQWGNNRALADMVKTINPKTVVIMGGTHVSGLPEDALRDSASDFVVRQQGDVTFSELLDALFYGRPVENVTGIVFRRNNEVLQTKNRGFLKSMDTISKPDYSMVDLSLYSSEYHSGGRRQVDHGYLTYGFTTIGCDVRCTFCTIPKVQGGWLQMNKTSLDQYLYDLKAEGVTEFIVEDDHLFHDPEWVLTVCDLLEKHQLPWFEEGGVALFALISLLPEVSEEFILKEAGRMKLFEPLLKAKRAGLTLDYLVKRMRESGCYSLYLAVESSNADALSTANKPSINSIEYYTQRVVNTLHKNNIHVTAGLMFGFVNPTYGGKLYVETRDEIEASLRYGAFIIGAGATYMNPFIFTPLPAAPHFYKLLPHATKNTDEGYSHEFATMNNAPEGQWTKDEVNLLRVRSLVEVNGIERYRTMLQTGTWPVERECLTNISINETVVVDIPNPLIESQVQKKAQPTLA